MSTAYYIVVDAEDPAFDPFVDGKMLTRHLDEVNAIAAELGLRQLEDFAFQDLSEFVGPDMDVEWFEPAEGIDWAKKILQYIRENSSSLPDSEAVAGDLEEYQRVFRAAEAHGNRWHLALDF